VAHTLFSEKSDEGPEQSVLERALVQILVRVASIHVRNLKPDARSRVPGEAYCARGDATLSGVRELLEWCSCERAQSAKACSVLIPSGAWGWCADFRIRVHEEWQHARQPPRRRVLRQEISFPVDCGCLASAQSACPRTRLCGMQAEGPRYEVPPGRTRRPMKRVFYENKDPRSSRRVWTRRPS
jgi:hypothetical protein